MSYLPHADGELAKSPKHRNKTTAKDTTHRKMEEQIIAPVSKELLKSELTPERQMRMTNKSHNEIYIVTAHNAPNVMQEIGRLREIAFREAGGGTGKSEKQ